MNYSDSRITSGDNDRSEAMTAIADGQYLRSGLSTKGVTIGPAARDFATCSLDELARISLDWAGVSYRGLDRFPLMRLAFEVSRDIDSGKLKGQRSTSFTAIVGNVFAKMAQASFSQVPSSWKRWCSISPAKNFQRTSRVGLTDAPILEKLGGNGEIRTLLLADREEYQTAQTRAGILKIAREIVFNDDLQVIAGAVAELGKSADATVNVGVYDLLTSQSGTGPTLNQTGAALFSATHSNYTSPGSALSVATLDVARKALRRQADPESGRRINTAGRYLICPPSMEAVARVLAGADRIDGDPDNLQVVVEAALEDAVAGTTAFYLAGDQNVVPTVDVAFVGGPEPILDTKYSFDTDSLEVRARVAAGVAVLDYRGIYRNAGA